MSKPEIESKLVVGDDGELLEDDTNIDMAVYYDSIADPYPPPTPIERVRYTASNNPIVWIIILVILGIIAIAMWPTPSLPRTDLDPVQLRFATMTAVAISNSEP